MDEFELLEDLQDKVNELEQQLNQLIEDNSTTDHWSVKREYDVKRAEAKLHNQLRKVNREIDLLESYLKLGKVRRALWVLMHGRPVEKILREATT